MYVTDDVAANIQNDTRPIDRSPSIGCDNCNEFYDFKGYWRDRYVEGKSWDPHKVSWLCDDCLDTMYEWYKLRKQERQHKTLTEWSQ